MTKRISKFISMLLAAVMVLSMAMTGLAAEIEPMSSSTDTEFTITVKNAADGETYKAYKIFDVTYDDSNNYSYTIDSDSAWYSTVAAATGVFTLTQVGDSTTYVVTIASDTVTDDQIIAVFTGADIDLSNVEANATTTAASGQAVLDVTDSGAGYYYVTTSLGSLVIIDTTNPTQTIEEKNGIPTTDKKILTTGEDEEDVEEDTETSENEKAVKYEIKVDSIQGVYNLLIEDAMNVYVTKDDGVGDTFDDNITYSFDYDNLTVTLYDYDENGNLVGTKLSIKDDYILIIPEEEGVNTLEDGCDFHIAFFEEDEDEVKTPLYDFSGCSDQAYIQVTVSCTIDAAGYAFGDDEIMVPNNARVTFGEENKSTSEWNEADVYEYGFEIFKYADEQTPLADAIFALTNADGETAYFRLDDTTGKYVLEGWVDLSVEGTAVPDGYTAEIVTISDGMAYIEGLAADIAYTLTETKSPDGYNQLTSSLTITITADEETPSNFTVSVDGEAITGHIVNVLNQAGALLPGTGGMGTTLFYVIGVVLILGAAVLFVTKKRLDKE